ncbi:MAG: N4-gp56 family major capsid protein [Nitrospirota bacterium]|nr:N4-gp56 family major capsid protein [Nitrospirota bacterium]
MAETTTPTGLAVQQWDERFFEEYVRASRYARYMGTDENAIVQLKENLTKKQGDRVTFALVHELAGAGVTGNTTLQGNEEALDTRSHAITVDVVRHAVVVTTLEEQKSAIALRDAARARLRSWAMKKLRDSITTALGSIDGVAYASATAGQKNAWHTNNTDRVLYGSAVANFVAANHASSLANVDSVNDTLKPGVISLAKRLAQAATPKIRPITVDGDEEWFVLFCHPRAFRDLKNDTTMMQANRDALARGADNPLFTGGDLIWDGVIIKEVHEIPVIAGAGAGTPAIDVAPGYLCGAQAVGLAWAQRTRTATQETDYEFRHGVAVQEIRGLEKLRFGTGAGDTTTPKDNGVFTLFTAGVADA